MANKIFSLKSENKQINKYTNESIHNKSISQPERQWQVYTIAITKYANTSFKKLKCNK